MAIKSLIKKTTSSTTNTGPAKKPGLLGKAGKPSKPAKAVEVEEEEEEEIEEAPAPKKPAGKLLGKAKPKAAPVEEEEEEETEEESEEEEAEEEETEESEEAEEESEEEEEEAEEEEAEEEEEEEAPAKPVKKGLTKPGVKAAPAKASKAPVKAAPAKKAKSDEEAPASTGKGLFGSKPKKASAPRVVEEGAVLPKDELARMMAAEFGCTAAEAANSLKKIETFMLEQVFPKYDVNLFGARFKRSIVAPRLFNTVGGLEVQTDGLSTLISEHVRVTGTIYFGKERKKGQGESVDDFVEGTLNAKGKFVPTK